jgi:hypothetical protein
MKNSSCCSMGNSNFFIGELFLLIYYTDMVILLNILVGHSAKIVGEAR